MHCASTSLGFSSRHALCTRSKVMEQPSDAAIDTHGAHNISTTKRYYLEIHATLSPTSLDFFPLYSTLPQMRVSSQAHETSHHVSFRAPFGSSSSYIPVIQTIISSCGSS
ncbi:hypothetical protein Scep_014741 [Stephania cephalantha]|uniref:Uncharacterized protein n=1 Tax=Stephania cephalantha TaxID=152367 RepID=A0AAP0J384_9MAGN